jgi:hypothetical protein
MPAGGAAGAAGAAMATISNPMGPLVAGAKPKVRNPMMTLILSEGLIFGGGVLSTLLGMIGLGLIASLGSLVSLVGLIFMCIYAVQMLRELQNYTQDDQFIWWYFFIPCLGIYFAVMKVPEQVTKAKTKAGILQAKPVKGIVHYLFLWPMALANDLNDIAQS